jgi:hypothetical protein
VTTHPVIRKNKLNRLIDLPSWLDLLQNDKDICPF